MAIRVLTSLVRHRQVRRHFLSQASPIQAGRYPDGSSSIQNRFWTLVTGSRGFDYSTLSEKDHNKEMDDINSKFAEARDEIELALESKETVYFNEEAETARVTVQAVLDKYQALLAKLGPQERGAVQRSMGMKMEQLKAELAQLKED